MITVRSKSRPELLDRVESFGFVAFDNGDYDLNLIAERRLTNRKHNSFDDVFNIVYKIGDLWITESGACTIDPGRYWLTKEDYKGCAVYYHPQQARSAYRLGNHRGNSSHPALLQKKAVKYWRDWDKDEQAEYEGEIHTGRIGLNIHRSSTREGGSKYVEKWSAGCIVWKDSKDHLRMIELCKLQRDKRGWHNFSFTLIPQEV